MENLGIDNLKLVCTDAIIVAQDLVDAAKDGIQITDAVVVFKDLGKIQSVASHAKQALAELKDLSPDESAELAEHVSATAGLDDDVNVERLIKGSLRLAARAHRVVAEAVDIVNDAKDLYA